MAEKIVPSVIEPAQRFLELTRSRPLAVAGPHRFINPQDRELFRASCEEVVRAVEKVEERTYKAPSAWHAAAWLLQLAGLLGRAADIDPSVGFSSPYSPQLGAPIFRGQRDPSWGLAPTILREPQDAADWIALGLYIDECTTLFNYEENNMNVPYVHMGAAQHYGLKTPLLDFTVDPRVAVHFACRGAESATTPEVAVYWIPFNVALALGGVPVLAPPWVKRLYAQRGLFIDCSSMISESQNLDDGGMLMYESQELEDACFRILFPPDSQYTDDLFGNDDTALLPDDPWYTAAVAWAAEMAQLVTTKGTARGDLPPLADTAGQPPFRWGALQPSWMIRHPKNVKDICEWLALKVVDGTPTYDCEPFGAVWRHNRPLLQSMRVQWEFLQKKFPTVSEIRPNMSALGRQLAFLEAVTNCVDEHEDRGPPND